MYSPPNLIIYISKFLPLRSANILRHTQIFLIPILTKNTQFILDHLSHMLLGIHTELY
jgi:hypothetical protein